MIVQKLGSIPLYRSNTDSAAIIFHQFEIKKSRSVAQIGPPQVGKTNTALVVAEKFANLKEKEGKPYQIIVLICISDNEILDQWISRVEQTGLKLSQKIKVYHHKQIENIPALDIDTLLILDECHIALGKELRLDAFFRQNGINYGQNYNEWKNQNTWILSVSATQYAQTLQANLQNYCFDVAILKPGDNYYSIEECFVKGRIKQAKSVVDRKRAKVSSFFQDVLRECLFPLGEPKKGYLVVRSTGKGPDYIKQYIEENFKDQVAFREFSSKGEKDHVRTVAKLDSCLSTEPADPTLIVVRGALRAGKTLGTTKYILGCIDSHKSTTDTATQSFLGRFCGYTDEKEHSKFDDNFPIYLDEKRNIEDTIKHYNSFQKNAQPFICNGLRTRKSKIERTSAYIDLDNYFDLFGKGKHYRLSGVEYPERYNEMLESFYNRAWRSESTPNIINDGPQTDTKYNKVLVFKESNVQAFEKAEELSQLEEIVEGEVLGSFSDEGGPF